MAQTYAQAQGAIFRAQPIAYAAGINLLRGEKGPFAIPCLCDFGATGIPATGYVIDPKRFYDSGAIKAIQTIFFDNSQCSGTTQVFIPAFNQILSLPANSCGYFPILSPLLSGGQMTVTSAATSGVATITLLNTFINGLTWSVVNNSQGAAIPVSDATLDGTVTLDGVAASSSKINVRTKVAQLTATDRSGTIAAAGASQVLAAVNVNRQGLEIQNIDSAILEGLWYNPSGGACTPGGAGCFELAAASSAQFPGGFAKIVTSNQVTISATTIAHKFSAIEY